MAKVESMAGGGHRLAVSREERKPKKAKLHRVEVTRAKNGGHVVRHHFGVGPDVPYMEPTEHVFGKAEGDKLMSHLKRHLGVKDMEPVEAAAGPEEGADHEEAEAPSDVEMEKGAENDAEDADEE